MNKPILIAISALTIFGCSKSPLHLINSFYATVDETNAMTRVSACADGYFGWCAGDEISVFDVANGNHKFTSQSTYISTDFSISGSGIVPGKYAVFPYSNNCSVSNDEIVVELPNSYDITEPLSTGDNTDWRAEMPMLGIIDGNNIRFKNIGAILSLTVYNVPSDATTLTFTAPKNKITGAFTIADGSANAPSISTSATNGSDNQIVFTFTRRQNMTFRVPLPVGTIEGFSISFNDSKNTTKTVSKNIVLNRNSFVLAPDLNLGSSEAWVQHPTPTHLISHIFWVGMYQAGAVHEYRFTYDDANRLASLFHANELKTEFEYAPNQIVWREYDWNGTYTLKRSHNTLWLYGIDASVSEGLPFFVYNYDGTASRVFDNPPAPSSGDLIWDENHNLTEVEEERVDYSDTPNIWSGVSLNAFLLSYPPGAPIINDEIAHMHTANLPSSITWMKGDYAGRTTNFDFTYDADYIIRSGTLTDGVRNGESFDVFYDEFSTDTGIDGIVDKIKKAGTGSVSGKAFVNAVVTMAYGNRVWIEDRKGAVLLYMPGHHLNNNHTIYGLMNYCGTMYGSVPEMTSYSGVKTIPYHYATYDGTRIAARHPDDGSDSRTNLSLINDSFLNRLLHLSDVSVSTGFTGTSSDRDGTILDAFGNTFPIRAAIENHGISLAGGTHFDDLWVIPSIESGVGLTLYYFGSFSTDRTIATYY